MTLTAVLTADQQRALENLRAAVVRLWERPLHRYYTDHGVRHSERIIALLDGLTAGMKQTPSRLASVEAFVLLAAATLHDIGMQDERFAGGDLEEIRAHHHERTAEMIFRVFEDPGRAFALPLGDDPGLVEAIALVAQGHRRVDLDGPEYDPIPLGGETVRPRLLAALLRFGDELDIDYRRVDLEVMRHVLDLPVDSQLHWWRCHYVSGVSIVDEYIRVAYRFPRDRPDYEPLLIPLIEGEIRAKHAALEPIFRRHAVKVAIGQPQVRLMRLVQPMPPEVEALAREGAGVQGSGGVAKQESREAGKQEIGGAGKEESWETGKQDGRGDGIRDREGEEADLPADRADDSKESPALPAPVFNQQGQIVGTQINVAGDLYGSPAEQPAARTQRAKDFERVRELARRAGREDDFESLEIAVATAKARQDHPPTQLEKTWERVSDESSILGMERAQERRQVAEYEAALVAYWKKWKSAPPAASSPPPAADVAALRVRLQRLDAVEVESLCLDHFPEVYDKFGRGLRRDEMVNLLLDHCRRKVEEANRLAGLLV